MSSVASSNQFANWPELKRACEEKRCEIVLTNQQLDKREPSINDEALQSSVFYEDSPVNFLDFSQVGLSVIYPVIANLRQLTNLVLRSNRLKELPEELGNLEKLKLLDLSFNEIEKLPVSLNGLAFLASVNVSNNKISKLPDLSALSSLQSLDVSHNALTTFPTMLPSGSSKLQMLMLNSNRIKDVPDDIKTIADQLKTLDLSENELQELPLPLAFLPKLKVLNLASNRFADKRFGKLAEDKRHSAPSMLDYLKKKAPAQSTSRRKDKSDNNSVGEETDPCTGPSLTVHFGSNKIVVKRVESVVEIRPYIACCLLRNIEMDAGKLKLVLAIQNRLHDTVCAHRTLATIGTHDCEALALPLTYTALEPEELIITPLHKKSSVTGQELVANLTAEAELLRKKQKRNTFSSIHKYLYLVEKLPQYPCIVDDNNSVLSFAPVTNSETTKLSLGTKEIFVEVTSNESQSLCRTVMDRFIEEIAVNKFSSNLVVEQIKVFQHTGELLIAYPGKLDLQLSSVSVRREVIKEGEESKSC